MKSIWIFLVPSILLCGCSTITETVKENDVESKSRTIYGFYISCNEFVIGYKTEKTIKISTDENVLVDGDKIQKMERLKDETR